MADAPDDLDGVLADLDRGLRLIDAKADGYALAQSMYDGTASEVFASAAVRKQISDSAAKHPLSFAHIPVDALVGKIECTGITAEKKPADDWLTEQWDANDLDDEVDDWHRKAAYFGDYYAIIDPTTEGTDGKATELVAVGSSPFTTVVVYSGKDGRTALYGVKRWRGSGGRWFANVYYDDVTIALWTPLKTDAPKAELFQPLLNELGEEDSERQPHLGGRMLVVHYAVDGRPYGTPVHRKAFGPQDAITKLSATNLATVDAQGFPTRWALLDPMAEVDDDIDDDFGTDAPTTPAGSGDNITGATTGKTRIRTLPGSINLLRGVKATGEYASATSDNFLKNLDWYVRAMAVACGVALHEFDWGGNQPSGEARRRANARLNDHAGKVIRSFKRTEKNLADVMLGVAGLESAVAINYQPTETASDLEGLTLVSAKIKAGVPVTVALLEAGYTDEQVEEWYPDGDPHVTPELLTIVATALGQLGTALTLGVVNEAEVAAMLPTILTGARLEGPAVGAPTGVTTVPVAPPVVTVGATA